jgi:hypothetical protein
MAFFSARPIAGSMVGLLFAAAIAVPLPFCQVAAQTKTVPAAESAATSPPAKDAVKDGDSRPTKVSDTARERDRRLDVLRLLLLGGGSYRPFGTFR